MMITASWPSMVVLTSALFSTSPTTTLDALWSAGSLAGSRTSTVTLYPGGGHEETKQVNRETEATHTRTIIIVIFLEYEITAHITNVIIMQPHDTYISKQQDFSLISCIIFQHFSSSFLTIWKNVVYIIILWHLVVKLHIVTNWITLASPSTSKR